MANRPRKAKKSQYVKRFSTFCITALVLTATVTFARDAYLQAQHLLTPSLRTDAFYALRETAPLTQWQMQSLAAAIDAPAVKELAVRVPVLVKHVSQLNYDAPLASEPAMVKTEDATTVAVSALKKPTEKISGYSAASPTLIVATQSHILNIHQGLLREYSDNQHWLEMVAKKTGRALKVVAVDAQDSVKTIAVPEKPQVVKAQPVKLQLALNTPPNEVTGTTATSIAQDTQFHAADEAPRMPVEPQAPAPALEYSDLVNTFSAAEIQKLDEVIPTEMKSSFVDTKKPETTIVVTTHGVSIQKNTQVRSAQAQLQPAAPVAAIQAAPQEPELAPAQAAYAAQSTSTDDIRTERAADAPVIKGFYGVVVSGFSGAELAVAGAKVQIVGSDTFVMADDNGSFSFPEVDMDGVLPVIISKDGYHWRRADLVHTERKQIVELLPLNASRMAALTIGETTRNNEGFLFVELVDPEGGRRNGYSAWLISASEQGASIPAKYVDENGAPQREAQSTNERGQFLFSSVPTGTYILVVADVQGRERAPHVIHVGAGEGVIQKISLGRQVLLQGQIVNGQTSGAPVSKAEVRLLGTRVTAVTGKDGRFAVGPIYLDCDSMNYIQVERQGFYRNRMNYKCDAKPHAYYAMPTSYVDAVTAEAGVQLSPLEGVVFGHVRYAYQTKAQLLGTEELAPEKGTRGLDFYFERDGLLNPSRNHTASNGNFIITGAPAESSYLQIFDANNRTRAMFPVLTSQSTVNVFVH